MKNVIKWKIEDWCDHTGYEAMIEAVGGPEMAPFREAQKRARVALEADLSPAQHARYAVYSDAVSDAWSAREAVAVRVALTAGIAIGGALVTFPDEPAAQVIDLAVSGVVSLLCADLPPDVAQDVARMALRVLARAEEAPVGHVGGHRRIARSGIRVVGKE